MALDSLGTWIIGSCGSPDLILGTEFTSFWRNSKQCEMLSCLSRPQMLFMFVDHKFFFLFYILIC